MRHRHYLTSCHRMLGLPKVKLEKTMKKASGVISGDAYGPGHSLCFRTEPDSAVGFRTAKLPTFARSWPSQKRLGSVPNPNTASRTAPKSVRKSATPSATRTSQDEHADETHTSFIHTGDRCEVIRVERRGRLQFVVGVPWLPEPYW